MAFVKPRFLSLQTAIHNQVRSVSLVPFNRISQHRLVDSLSSVIALCLRQVKCQSQKCDLFICFVISKNMGCVVLTDTIFLHRKRLSGLCFTHLTHRQCVISIEVLYACLGNRSNPVKLKRRVPRYTAVCRCLSRWRCVTLMPTYGLFYCTGRYVLPVIYMVILNTGFLKQSFDSST